MSDDAPVVVTENLTKRYGDLVAIDNLSIWLHRGQILGFIGPNGAGKTTTIRILVGQALPTDGKASIAGADCVHEAKKIKRLVGYMPDVFGSYDNMRVHEYLDFFGAAFSIPKRKRAARIEEVMETAGCTYMRDRYVESLSHGMKQRVAIARTLIHDPEVLILDEPANGLDPQARIEMREVLLRLAGMGKALIVTSHVLPELSRICDHVAMITQGRLRAFGPLAEIMRKVNQRRLFEVQLTSAARVADTVDLLRQELDVESEVTGSSTEAIVRFRTTEKDDKLALLLAKLTAEGIPVSQFRELQTDLEDTFLSIARESEQSNEDRRPAQDETSATTAN